MSQLDGLPGEAKQVLTLQLKPKWTKADHALMADLTRAWSDVHRQVFADRFSRSLLRPIRWK
jgi:hypothetical protein